MKKKIHKRSIYFKNEDLWDEIDAAAKDEQRSTNNYVEVHMTVKMKEIKPKPEVKNRTL